MNQHRGQTPRVSPAPVTSAGPALPEPDETDVVDANGATQAVPSHSIENLCPYGDDNQVMSTMWVGCLGWAIGKPEIRASFEADTKRPPWQTKRGPIERMIDDATGYEDSYVRDFIVWFNVNVWGEDDGSEIEEALRDA